jgi:hypothetical protein
MKMWICLEHHIADHAECEDRGKPFITEVMVTSKLEERVRWWARMGSRVARNILKEAGLSAEELDEAVRKTHE